MRSIACLILALPGIVNVAVAASPAPQSPAPRPAAAATEPRERARALAKEAAALIEKGELGDAEEALLEAVGLGPAPPADHYNLACVRALLGKHDVAIDSLERAARVGFTDFALVARDPDLDTLRGLPRFRQLLARKDDYLRRTAEGTLVALRNRFGAAGYRYAIDHEQHLIYAAALADDVALARLRAALGAQAASLQAALFEHKPEAYITVLMPTPADYGKLVRFRNVPGIYIDSNKTLVARESGFVLRHEFTHALHAADRGPLGQEHAPWVAEGLGAMCESADFGGGVKQPAGGGGETREAAGAKRDVGDAAGVADGPFRPRDNPRFARLVGAARRRALIPLERLVAMKQDEFVRRPNLTYAQSGYLMLYLWEKDLLRPFYDAYKTTYASDPSGRVALEQATARKLPDLHEEWRLWLAARVPTGAPDESK